MSHLAHSEREREPPAGSRLVLSWIWALSPAWSLGFATAPIMVFAAFRYRHIANWALAAVYVACAITLIVTAGAADDSALDNVFEAVLAVNIFVGTGHALIVRSRVFSRRPERLGTRAPGPQSALEQQRSALAADEEQAKLRRVALEIVEDDPIRAVYLQIGRIDLPGRQFPDGGLIDLNNVPHDALKQRIEVLAPYTDQLVDARQRLRGFSSLEDMSIALSLPPLLLDHLADRLVFLPYYGHS